MDTKVPCASRTVLKQFAGASSYVVLIIAHRLGRVAVSRCYRADDPAVAVEDEILFQHAFLQQEYTEQPRRTAISGG